MRTIYLDHAATTPAAPEVLEQMLPFFSEVPGNPSSMHAWGRAAHMAVDRARAQTAKAIGAKKSEIYFTSSGTESDNWAVRGAAYAALRQKRGNHIITTAIEHHAVLNTCRSLEEEGFRVTCLPVDTDGLVDPASVESAIEKDTILISVMAANNEIGTTEPIPEIGSIARRYGILFHTDAVQAIGAVPVNVNDWQVDLLSLSAHKFYGPKGVGALYIRHGFRPDRLLFGGVQERGLRGGTENVPGIVGLGAAIKDAVEKQAEQASVLASLREHLADGILSAVPGTRRNGHTKQCLPGILNISFPGADQDLILRQLELRGIFASAGAACSSGQSEASHVLQALHIGWENVISAVRFSLGRNTTREEIETVLRHLPEAVREAESLRLSKN